MDPRACESCKGSGLTDYGNPPYSCHTCKGDKVIHPPDIDAILGLLLTKPNKAGKRRWRVGFNPKADRGTQLGRRAYYVWRMTRFHGGADVTLPMMASYAIHGDPFRKELDALADALARSVFGTDLAGAWRWRSAMTGEAPPPGLPWTSYSGAPVVDDEHKLEEEEPEVR